ncbi:MAG: hypothetical protein ABJD11_07610 [Gemmatimonadota bacterium]
MHQPTREPSPGRLILAVSLFALAIIPLLALVPRWIPTPPGVLSAATVEGYNNSAASLLAGCWAVAGVAVFWLAFRTGFLELPETPHEVLKSKTTAPHASVSRLGWQGLLIAVVVLILYFPPFLARYGPYVEDQVFFTALHRMQAGQVPYLDFEFLYGPLMIYAAAGWTKLFGYSMVSFYSYLMVLELMVYLMLLVVVTKFVPERRQRLLVFLLLALLLFDTLLAPNQNGLRKFFPLCIMLVVACRPASLAVAAAAGSLLGVQLAYSQEYGVAGFLGIVAMYGLVMLRGGGLSALVRALVAGLTAACAWLVIAWLLMGQHFGAYTGESLSLLQRFSAGEAAFRFYWTANSLALFGLLALACVLIGRSLAQPLRNPSDVGDRLLVGAFVYALVGLKSGLNRCDLWHLDPAFIPLIASLLLPLQRALVPDSRTLRRLIMALVMIAALSYTVGQAPLGSFYLRGLARGARDVLSGRRRDVTAAVPARAASIGPERTHPNPEALHLQAYLADSARRQWPVFFYSDMWALGPQIGVYKTDHLNDNFIYSDARGRALRTWLEERPSAVVVIDSLAYQRLYGLAPILPPERSRDYLRPTRMKSIVSWLASVHYRGAAIEYQLRERRWSEAVGDYVRARFHPIASFGNMVVLGRAGGD